VRELLESSSGRHGRRKPEHIDLVEALLPAWLGTPLDAPVPGGPGGPPPGFALRDLSRSHRLDELGFDLRLGKGSRYVPNPTEGRVRGDATRLALAEALRPEAGFGGQQWLAAVLARRNAEGELRTVFPSIAGFMTGFIDLVFRVGGRGAEARYFVADYKSNKIVGQTQVEGAPSGPLRAHYTRPWMRWKMDHAAYHLQALVYTVALHRLLRQRLGAKYSYDRHIGGHLYLFLRGMEGERAVRSEGAALGVWADRWPTRTVLGLDAALDGKDCDEVQRAMDAGGAR
jgi:exodeoxyribonuclease V beta subunit